MPRIQSRENEWTKKGCYALFELMKRENHISTSFSCHVWMCGCGCVRMRAPVRVCVWRPEDKLCCWAMPSVIFGTGYLAVCSPGWLADQFPGILLFQGFTPHVSLEADCRYMLPHLVLTWKFKLKSNVSPLSHLCSLAWILFNWASEIIKQNPFDIYLLLF